LRLAGSNFPKPDVTQRVYQSMRGSTTCWPSKTSL